MTKLSSPRRPASLARQLALALALASGTAVLAVPGLADAAHAQRKKKKDDDAAEAAKPIISKEFADLYNPLTEAINTPNADIASLKPRIVALKSLAISADEQHALGNLMYNAGIGGSDPALQLEGAEVLLASGKTNPELIGRYAFNAFLAAQSLKDYGKARTYLQQAIDRGYVPQNATADDLKLGMADIYFAENRNAEGLQYLTSIIEARKAEGLPVDSSWYRRGVQVAYNNKIVPQVYDFVQGWVITSPTPENWRDAVNLTRNLNRFEGPVLIDLLRLGRKIGTLKEKEDFIIYVEVADPQRLPREVVAVLDEAYDSGLVPRKSDSWIEEQYAIAEKLVAQDEAALPALERDASAASADLKILLSAGNTFLSYGQYAKAATFYERSLTLPGVDRDLALTRLGIAQIGAGNFDAARETLAKVEGDRAPIAMLWSAYASQEAGEGASASGG